LNLKAKFESGLSYFSFNRLIPGAFNVGLIGSTCTALPRHALPALSPAAYTRPATLSHINASSSMGA
jgi:hypothetical protein